LTRTPSTKSLAALGDGEAIEGDADDESADREPEDVVLHPLAEVQQVDGEGRELAAELVIELGELRNDDREHEDEQSKDEYEQHAGIDERADELLAQGEGDFLEADVAVEDFGAGCRSARRRAAWWCT
jgi:hypothetical protein